MEWITYSWLACCATAPSVAAIAVWVLFIFHTYRRRWRTVDIFLLTIGLQEIPSTLCAFGYAVVTVIRTRSESSCSFVIWGLTTTRVFQLTTLTSLAFDRALTLKWPYKYRFSVRHSQVKYHVVVLGVISALVGIAGLFARLQYHDYRDQFMVPFANSNVIASNSTTNYCCTLHPYSWDYRYNIFISALYAVLTFITFVCSLYIEIHRYRGNSRPNSRISSVGNLVADHLGSTEGIGRSESYRTLYGFQTSKHGSINKKTLDDQRAFDLRWSTVIGTIGLCYAVNHGPYVAFSVAGLLVPFWNPLHDNIAVWLSIVEGLLLPIALYITDDPFRDAVKRSFKRRNHRCSDVSKNSDGPFPLYFNDFAMIDKKPYLMSSIPAGATGSALTLVSNYRRSFKGGSKSRRSIANDQLLRPSNGCLSSLRKCKMPKNNDRYMFLSIYGVDKVIPVNKQSTTITTDQNLTQCVNPYYKNCTTISTFVGSDNSIKKEKLQTTLQRPSSIEKNFPWYHVNNPLGHHHMMEDSSWQSHHHELLLSADNKEMKEQLEQQLDEHIYATLSDTFSVRSTLPDKRQLKDTKIETVSGNTQSPVSIHKNDNKSGTMSVDGFSMSGVSFTTTANDDFEFTRGVDADACINTIVGTSNHDNEDNDADDDGSNNNNDSISSSVSSGSYTVDDFGPKGHIYDNLAFEFENMNASSIVAHPNSLESSSGSTPHAISAINYLQRRYSPFVSKGSSAISTYYKRRGRQSFSASDLHKLDSPIYSFQQINDKRPPKDYREYPRSSSSASSPRKTLSETNLLSSSKNRSGSLTKIAEHGQHGGRPQSTSGELDEMLSDDSINSNSNSTTSSSWDIHAKLAEVLRKKNQQSSVAMRQKAYINRKSKSRIRTKKFKTRQKEPQKIYHHQHSSGDIMHHLPKQQLIATTQSPVQFHNNQSNLYGQSVWSVENNRPVVKLSGITRIGSYAQDWCTINKSMPDLSSLTSCPSPVFSPLYRKESKLRSPND